MDALGVQGVKQFDRCVLLHVAAVLRFLSKAGDHLHNSIPHIIAHELPSQCYESYGYIDVSIKVIQELLSQDRYFEYEFFFDVVVRVLL